MLRSVLTLKLMQFVPTGAFTVCSFWMVKALATIGRLDEARTMFESLLGTASHVGLYSEDLAFGSRRQLGNFPQAYRHLAGIDCAMALNEAEGVPEDRLPADECEDRE